MDGKNKQEETSENEEIAISALLMLANQDPWTIKKKITESDRNSSSRLLLSTKLVKEHILPQLNIPSRREIHSEKGLTVRVRDCDTGDVIALKLKWWQSSRSFVFNEGWRSGFVKRRELENGDEIGMFWNRCEGNLVFSVLNRAGSSGSSG